MTAPAREGRERETCEAAWQWITDRVNDGRGPVQFCYTDNGSIGVFVDTGRGAEETSLGVGDTALEAVQAAIRHAARRLG